MNFIFPYNCWECHHPNWRTPSFFRGVGIPPTIYIYIFIHIQFNIYLSLYIYIYLHKYMSMGKKSKTIESIEFSVPHEFPGSFLGIPKSPCGSVHKWSKFGWFGGTPISGNLNIYIYIFTYIDIHLDIHIDIHIDIHMNMEQEQEQDRSFIEYIII